MGDLKSSNSSRDWSDWQRVNNKSSSFYLYHHQHHSVLRKFMHDHYSDYYVWIYIHHHKFYAWQAIVVQCFQVKYSWMNSVTQNFWYTKCTKLCCYLVVLASEVTALTKVLLQFSYYLKTQHLLSHSQSQYPRSKIQTASQQQSCKVGSTNGQRLINNVDKTLLLTLPRKQNGCPGKVLNRRLAKPRILLIPIAILLILVRKFVPW